MGVKNFSGKYKTFFLFVENSFFSGKYKVVFVEKLIIFGKV